MRTLLVLMLVWSWTTAAWAKTVKIPKGTSDVNQLHDELLAQFPAWRGTPQPDGSFKNPLLRVEHTDQEIRLSVPDETDEGAIQAVVKTHRPKPRKDVKALKTSAKRKLKDLGLTQDEVDVLLSD